MHTTNGFRGFALSPLAVVALMVAFPVNGQAWSDVAHRVIGDIAESGLPPSVMLHLRELFGPTMHLRDLAPCADLVRRSETLIAGTPCSSFVQKVAPLAELGSRYGNTAAWHYIDIPVGGKYRSQDLRVFCPSICAPERIEFFTRQLASPDPAKQAEAVLFLVHLVGDLHQPLHVATRNGDLGGNSVYVSQAGRSLSLHYFWDTQIVARMSGPGPGLFAERSLSTALLSAEAPDAGSMDPWQWAVESEIVAEQIAYRDIPDIRVLPGTPISSAY